MSEPRWLRPLLFLVLVLWLAQGLGVEVAVDWLWFDALGYLDVYTRMLGVRIGLWVGGFLLGALFVAANLRHAVRAAPLDLQRLHLLMADASPGVAKLQAVQRVALGLAVVVPALMVAGAAGTAWEDLLLLTGQQPFGQTDPVFGLDIGFYIFELPVLQAAQSLWMAVVTITLLPVGAWYVARDVFTAAGGFRLSVAARRHASVLAAFAVLGAGAGAWLDRYAALSQQDGVVWGAGYADISARIPGLAAVALLSIVVAGVLVASTRRKGWSLPLGVAIGWLVLRGLAAGLIPQTVQEWVVSPSELELEREYLARNIEATRRAYALDRIEVTPFEAAADLTVADLEANPGTVQNIRVWDDRPLLTTYGQLQEIRLYYDFVDVDIDRYTIDGQLRQVMLSARELNASNLPAQARSFVNEHFQFTHGYGLTMSPVNVVTQEGLPELLIRDLPPQVAPALAADGFTVDRPEIYYGELTDRYVFVRTGAQEFDYPQGDENVYTDYAGEGGVPIGGLFRKALFALHFEKLDILLSQYLTDDSRVLFRRTIASRVGALAPFLRFDRDPYLVVSEGRLFWLVDAYTTARTYPYSEPIGSGRQSFNYIRNSVKVVVDAYDGDVQLYVADDSDPVIRAWAQALPGAFRDMDELPPGLAAHVRYPVDFFDVQAAMFKAYHMTDPTVFYNKEDMWELPRELYAGQDQPMESYYLIMKLPGEDKAEFILLVPFVPTNRDNMISWLAARCDPEHYGSLVMFQFPKQKLIYGPRQIESRIDQDPVISQQITLWSQSGSRVVRGNLLVIPIEDSLLYVEPLYLQAESSQLPELKRVIVSYENRIAMEETLGQALAQIFGASEQGEQLAEEQAAVRDVEEGRQPWIRLARRAQEQLEEAVARQQEGDWGGYGEALDALEQTVGRLAAEAVAADAGSSVDGAAPAIDDDGSDAPLDRDE
ncbi:MAG: UPF0182 family protein [Alphaproteobacteria bacterium]|nr:UPF0182 family protein [Alphaproteobacteria bacterium]